MRLDIHDHVIPRDVIRLVTGDRSFSVDVIWAVAEDGSSGQCLVGQDSLRAALAKGYIRHDI